MPSAGRAHRGVPRLRPERQRIRAARRALPGGARRAGARAACRRRRRSIPRDPLSRRMRGGCSKRSVPYPSSAKTEAVAARIATAATGAFVGVQADGDDALVRRLVDAAAMPALLEREGSERAARSVRRGCGCSGRGAARRPLQSAGRRRLRRRPRPGAGRRRRCARRAPVSALACEAIGRDVDGARYAVISLARPLSPPPRGSASGRSAR